MILGNYVSINKSIMENIVRLTDNIVVHDPEINLGKIDAGRLRAHGWSEQIVQQQLRRSQQGSADLAVEASDTMKIDSTRFDF
jgi:hypothetical protein